MAAISAGYIDLQEVRQQAQESQSGLPRNNQDTRPDHVQEQLRQRIRELESFVTSQNAELQEKEVMNRNYNALLDNLTKVRVEKDAIEENREKIYEDLQFHKEELARCIKENNTYKEQLEDRTKQMLKICNNAKEKERELMQKILFWKEKYDNESKEKEGIRERSSSIMIRSAYAKWNQNNRSDIIPLPKRRRRVFSKSPTVLPKCKNCLTVFDQQRPHEVHCRFHRSTPQPWKTWKKQAELGGQKSELDHANTDGYMYWPCCDRVGLKEPPGCLRLKSHELIFPDDEEKT